MIFCGGMKLVYAVMHRLSSFVSHMNNDVVYLYVAWSSSIFADMYFYQFDKMQIYRVTL
jgi:hypothetical protein